MDKSVYIKAESIQNALRYIDILSSLCKESKNKETDCMWQENASCSVSIAMKQLLFRDRNSIFVEDFLEFLKKEENKFLDMFSKL